VGATPPIDVLLVDYGMPTVDGGATVEHLRKLNPDVKVLLLSRAWQMRFRVPENPSSLCPGLPYRTE
jgi:CheY-like chemotaxis protein